MSNPEPSGTTVSKSSSTQFGSNRTAYVVGGALFGFIVGIDLVVHGGLESGRSAVWVLAAGPLFGALAGFELYLSRNWTRFGQLTPLIRLTVACAGTAGLLSAVGVLLGLIPRNLVWLFTAGGTVVGLLFGIRLFGTRVENWPGGERWKQ